jgi:hypothetical protein
MIEVDARSLSVLRWFQECEPAPESHGGNVRSFRWIVAALLTALSPLLFLASPALAQSAARGPTPASPLVVG